MYKGIWKIILYFVTRRILNLISRHIYVQTINIHLCDIYEGEETLKT